MSKKKQTSENQQGHAPLAGVVCRYPTIDISKREYHADGRITFPLSAMEQATYDILNMEYRKRGLL